MFCRFVALKNIDHESMSKDEQFYQFTPIQAVEAIKEIENAMERWQLARDNDDETLEKINQVLFGLGLLTFFKDDK